MSEHTHELTAMLNAAEQASAVCRDWFARAQGLSDEQRNTVLGTQIKTDVCAHYGYEDAFTLADKASEDTILPILLQCRDIMVVAEESCPNCADAPDGTQRWLVDPIDGTSRFKKGSPDFSITLALQTKYNGEWKTDIGMIAVPMTHTIYWADATHSVMQHNGIETPYQCTTDPVPSEPTSRQEALCGKRIEVAAYSNHNRNPQLTQARVELINKLKDIGAHPTTTFSTAKVLAEMAGENGTDGAILAGNQFDYAWDNDAAMHIAHTAGIHTQRYRLDGEPAMVFAREKSMLTALKLQLQEAYNEAGRKASLLTGGPSSR